MVRRLRVLRPPVFGPVQGVSLASQPRACDRDTRCQSNVPRRLSAATRLRRDDGQLKHRRSANLQARERFDSRPVMFSERCQWLWLSVAPAGPVPVSRPFRPGTPMQWRLGGSYKYQQRHSYSCRIGYQVATVIKTPVYCQTHTQGRDFTVSP